MIVDFLQNSSSYMPPWLFSVLFMLFSLMIGVAVSRVLQSFIFIASKKSKYISLEKIIETVKYPFDYLVIVTLFNCLLGFLNIDKEIVEVVSFPKTALYALGVYWLSSKVIGAISSSLQEKLSNKENFVVMLPLFRRVLKFCILFLVIIFVMQNYGIDVGALLAGLGIGGLAIALAGQKTLENLFGGISMFLDQPVRVGDFCKCGDVTGTIEDIGFRSTRIRTLDRTVVTLPNSKVSELKIESYAKRDKIKLYTKIGLIYGTKIEDLKDIISQIEEVLIKNENVIDGSQRVRFISFGDFSLDIEILGYVACDDWSGFLKIREDIYFEVMKIIQNSPSDFAFPSQTIYMEK